MRGWGEFLVGIQSGRVRHILSDDYLHEYIKHLTFTQQKACLLHYILLIFMGSCQRDIETAECHVKLLRNLSKGKILLSDEQQQVMSGNYGYWIY